jgi:tetratricopeptide (TPR) repeat protein
MLELGQLSEARMGFESGLGLNTPEAYLGLGLTFQGMGELDRAEAALRTAAFVAQQSGETALRAVLMLGNLEYQRSGCDAAVPHYERAKELLDRTTSHGLGMLGVSEYAWYIYYRASIAADMLPGLVYPVQTEASIAAMDTLADCLNAGGEAASSADHPVLQSAPGQGMSAWEPGSASWPVWPLRGWGR